MRFIVYGAGAVGGIVGGRMFQHGHDVVLVARGEHRRVIAERGLTVQWPEGEATLRVPVAGHAAELPLQVSSTSHTPAAARHDVPAVASAFAGHSGVLPEQLSATSQAPAAARHSVPAEARTSAGHAGALPSHVSCRTPASGRRSSAAATDAAPRRTMSWWSAIGSR